MRIFNATNAQMSIPLLGNQRISVAPHSVSGDFLGTTEFISLVVTSYDTSELAFIVSGVFELNMCANIPTATNYVVQSLEEALTRFKKEEQPEPEVKKVVEEPKAEDVVVEESNVVKEEEQPKTTKKTTTKKKK